MPEGHTLFRLAADLNAAFGGQPVEVTSPQGRFTEGAASVDGHVMALAESAGKNLFIAFEHGPIVHIHLGLIGTLRVGEGPPPDPRGALRLRIVGPAAYADLRGAITCALIDEADKAEVLSRLGPDPLRRDADPSKALGRIRTSRKPIGALLMDQQVLAGVGNVFRAEALFRARLHPLTPGNKVSPRRWNALWTDLVDLMEYGVHTGRIDTVRPEHEPAAMSRGARVDNHGGEVYVYRRAGQPCWACSSRVRTQVLEGRNLFWCPTCQRRR